jgi:hypothetical protein
MGDKCSDLLVGEPSYQYDFDGVSYTVYHGVNKIFHIGPGKRPWEPLTSYSCGVLTDEEAGVFRAFKERLGIRDGNKELENLKRCVFLVQDLKGFSCKADLSVDNVYHVMHGSKRLLTLTFGDRRCGIQVLEKKPTSVEEVVIEDFRSHFDPREICW